LANPDGSHLNLKQQLSLLLGSRVFNLANLIEIFERLAYYGLRTVVPIYMVLAVEEGGPQFSHVQKGVIYAWWALVQSLVPIMSGGLADRYGYKKTVGVSIAIKTAGYLIMAWCVELGAAISSGASTGVPGHAAVYGVFMLGALALAFGTAVFKPGIQSIIALSMPEGTKATGWAVFYQLVNVGGFFGPFLAGIMRLMSWKYVFIACAIIVCLNYIVLLMFEEPKKSGEGFGDAGVLSILWQSLIGVWQPRLFCFIVLFSGYWVMFNQLFDILPNFIDDWVDSSGALNTIARPVIEAFGGTVPAVWGGNLPQEHMINLNAGVCMTLAFLAGYLTSRMRAITAMAIGIGISCIAIYALGLSMNGWFTLAAIAGFSIGEITASPRKAEYLASLAPKGREGLYLGYVNATQAIGWSLGSLLAGALYESGGDKIILARRMLTERFDITAEAAAALPKTDVMPKLQSLAGLDELAARTLLWETYDPTGMWAVFALIGVSSMLGLFMYGALVKRISADRDWLFAVIALVYTFFIYDLQVLAVFAGMPISVDSIADFKLTIGFGVGLAVYALLRKHRPDLLPVGANESG